MPPESPSDRHAVIAAHKHDTTLFILAFSPACTAWLRAAKERIGAPRQAGPRQSYGRVAKTVKADGLRRISSARSWALGVLLCPEDDLSLLVAWARGLPGKSLARVRFFAAPTTDPDPILRTWNRAFNPLTDLLRPANPNQLARELLKLLNDWIYNDHAPHRPPGAPPR